MQIGDTAGQERFRSLTQMSVRNVHGVALVFDVTSSSSFAAVAYWKAFVERAHDASPSFILVGTKADLTAYRVSAVCQRHSPLSPWRRTMQSQQHHHGCPTGCAGRGQSGSGAVRSIHGHAVSRSVKQSGHWRAGCLPVHRGRHCSAAHGCRRQLCRWGCQRIACAGWGQWRKGTRRVVLLTRWALTSNEQRAQWFASACAPHARPQPRSWPAESDKAIMSAGGRKVNMHHH